MSNGEPDVTPFRIAIPEEQLDDLRRRLDHIRWPEEPASADWSTGTPLAAVRDLVDHWRDSYDWRRHEARLNEIPQFTTTVWGADIHFLHVRSPEPDALPLILSHGWPGSFVEFVDLIGPLTDPRAFGADAADAFHVVIPSLPGFVFSGPRDSASWSSTDTGEAWAELMGRLGYERFGAVGNDLGSVVSIETGRRAPDRVVGVHVNQAFSFPSGDPVEFASLREDDFRRLAVLERFVNEHSGFNKIQSTRPQTLAYGLADSPVGQLAWNLDLLRGFGEQDADTEASLDADWILTNVMLYWLTGTAASSARSYYADAHAAGDAPPDPTTTPLGVAVFAGDFESIRPFVERDHKNIHQWHEHDRGGHFAGTAAPDLLAADLRSFFRPLREN
jgi:epoxide hydrolase